ncbi:divalent-cation tolerance protein CutA [Balneolaceae bacterium YR4-1]|uniref:Divalent-cation tolerance protein CutA n=1 Tax=Halalkalibaculum roseum TaxID=2709311 RepID=A0A6M1TBY0_9BACT|nr:divalent-cation tolerance protein CutA [Halalkalibaculum roseum]NGP77623.1 divalent-cation tolerance protein CutA [Halalkalibaculum roseum]
MFNNLRLVYITTKDKKEAKTIGRKIVEERLAACVNIIDGMEAIYRWEDEIEEASECILIAKTPYHNVKELTERVKEMHSYDCPCVISVQLTEQEGNQEYQHWLLKNSKRQVINYEIEDI